MLTRTYLSLRHILVQPVIAIRRHSWRVCLQPKFYSGRSWAEIRILFRSRVFTVPKRLWFSNNLHRHPKVGSPVIRTHTVSEQCATNAYYFIIYPSTAEQWPLLAFRLPVVSVLASVQRSVRSIPIDSSLTRVLDMADDQNKYVENR